MPDTLETILFLTLQLPLLSTLLVLWEHVSRRPLYAVLCSALYEACVLGLAFIRKVMKELEGEAVKATSSSVQYATHSIFFRRRYKKRVVVEHDLLNVRGLGLISTNKISLDQMYVDLRIGAGNPRQFNVDFIARKEADDGQLIWHFLRDHQSNASEATALVIIGPPGCGKTTLLRHVALTLAANRWKRYEVRPYVPVLLFLRDHLATLAESTPPSLGKLLQNYYSEENLFPSLKPPPGWFEKQLERGKCIVLLDGLDEVAESGARNQVSAWVDNQIANYPRSTFVITSRPQGYREAPLLRADILEARLFNARQVKKFIENWYKANASMTVGRDMSAARQSAGTDPSNLLGQLHTSSPLSALITNPLLLTIVAMMSSGLPGADLPRTRVELYNKICEILLEHWQKEKGGWDSVSASQKLAALRPLAAYMMEHKLLSISTADASAVTAEPLARAGVSGDAAENFLDNLRDGSGLLIEGEPGRWGFAHLTFQEYLAATHWAESETPPRDWDKLVDDSWWYETLHLYAALADPNRIVEACLEANTLQSLALAASCLNEKLAPEVRHAAEGRIITDLESDDPARARLAAEVQLSLRLKSLGVGHRIDDGHVTCAEFQLFLDDMRARGKHHQPDHWTTTHFADGMARAPVTGTRAEDAVAFCDWLAEWVSQRQLGVARFRLPRPNELQAQTGAPSALAYWCSDGQQLSLEGLGPEAERELMRRLKDFQEASLPLTSLPTHTINLSRNLSHDPSTDRKIALALAVNLARGFNRKPERYLAHQLARACFASHASGVDVDQNSQLDQDVDLAIDLALALNRAFNIMLTIDPDKAFDRLAARALANQTVRDLARLVTAIDCGDFPEARRLIQALMGSSAKAISRLGTLLGDILAAADSKTGLAMRRAQRKYIARIFEYAYIAFEEIGHPDDEPGRRHWLSFRGQSDRGGDRDQVALELYWQLQIIMAREEGRLPSWEGIRLVRE